MARKCYHERRFSVQLGPSQPCTALPQSCIPPPAFFFRRGERVPAFCQRPKAAAIPNAAAVSAGLSRAKKTPPGAPCQSMGEPHGASNPSPCFCRKNPKGAGGNGPPQKTAAAKSAGLRPHRQALPVPPVRAPRLAHAYLLELQPEKPLGAGFLVVLLAPVLVNLEQFPRPYRRAALYLAPVLDEVADHVHLRLVVRRRAQDRPRGLQPARLTKPRPVSISQFRIPGASAISFPSSHLSCRSSSMRVVKGTSLMRRHIPKSLPFITSLWLVAIQI